MIESNRWCCEIIESNKDVVKWLKSNLKMLWNDRIQWRCCEMIESNRDVVKWVNPIKTFWNDQIQ